MTNNKIYFSKSIAKTKDNKELLEISAELLEAFNIIRLDSKTELSKKHKELNKEQQKLLDNLWSQLNGYWGDVKTIQYDYYLVCGNGEFELWGGGGCILSPKNSILELSQQGKKYEISVEEYLAMASLTNSISELKTNESLTILFESYPNSADGFSIKCDIW